MYKYNRLALLLISYLALSAPLEAAETYTVIVKNHEFTPKELKVAANKEFTLIVKNMDPSPMEFESFDLNREKIIGPTSDMSFLLGPIEKGNYPFFDDFHHDKTQGMLIAE